MAQSSAEMRARFVAVVILVEVAQVSFEYLSVITTVSLLPAFVFGRGPSVLIVTICSGPDGRNS